ncbi:MAG: isochorismatase family protein, partial [Ilumatobacteraceae bacterium]
MTTLENRPNTALLVVDVQNGVVAGAHERDAVVTKVAGLVERARREQVPVVWVQHFDEYTVRGSDDWRIVPELTPGDAEPLVEKHYGDSFEDTTLETVLSGLGVGRLVVVGAQTDECIRSTLHGALVRGYDATLVSDAHTTEDLTEWGAPPPAQVIAHTNLYWSDQTAP